MPNLRMLPAVLLFSAIYCVFPIHAQAQPLGLFDNHQDVGAPSLKGSATYNTEEQTYTLSGAGKNMWTNADQFQFVYKKLKGDFIIKATVQFIGKGVEGHRKIGIMARDKLTTDSRYADACVHGGLPLLTSLQYRTTDGDTTGQLIIPSNHPTDIELSRSGNTFTFSAAVFGENYKSVSKEMGLQDEVFAGLFICSHKEEVLEKAVFSNVQIIIPAAADFKPYTDYIGSNIEVMDIATGHRKLLHTAPNSLQAPNWTPDNKSLIYVADGLLYKYDLAAGTISKINTGNINDLNNDHVLSWDGKMIGISNHLGNKSVIYTMPVSGSSNPTQITSVENAPSYLHSWSLDNKNLIFTGQRNNEWNIYAINIASKKETALTADATLDDGAEYTPDGKYIYFNSVRTGNMQIWRMKPDGSQQEQVTFDEYNNWFPHISPDGKWIVYEAFPKEIDPTTHPFYKSIYIKLLPTTGGVARTIAYVYGGQGTMNVPSWSPDSKKIAFISNSTYK